MSQFRFRAPVQHIPGFRELEIDAQPLLVKLQKAGIKVPVGLLDNRYYFTDLEGWGKVLSDLTFKSNLYAKEKWDCDNYALKAMTVCAERYGLNTLGMVIGDIPTGRHAFNLFYYGFSQLIGKQPPENGRRRHTSLSAPMRWNDRPHWPIEAFHIGVNVMHLPHASALAKNSTNEH